MSPSVPVFLTVMSALAAAALTIAAAAFLMPALVPPAVAGLGAGLGVIPLVIAALVRWWWR